MRLALLLALLALPLAPHAQTAADSALVQRFSEAARLGVVAEQALGFVDDMPEAAAFIDQAFAGFTPEAYLDSIHAAFYRDLRPEALRAAVVAFESPQFDALLDYERTMGASPAELSAEMEAVLADPDAFDLADEALSREYLAATRTVETFESMMELMMPRMLGAFPGMEEEAAAQGTTVDAMVREMIATEMMPELEATFLLSTRYSLRDIPEDDVRFVTAFYSSPAGAYVTEAMYEGGMAAMEPVMDQMGAMFEDLFREVDALAPPPACKPGSKGCKASRPRD